MRYIQTILFVAFCGGLWSLPVLRAQTEPAARFLPPGAYKVIGFNTTPLLVQLIPFNRADPRVVGPYYVNWRSYQLRGDRLKGVKISFGVDLSDVQEAQTQAFLNFRLGVEGYRRLNARWGYTRGFNVVLSGGDFNTPGTKQGDGNLVLGVGPHWGVDFFVSPKVSLALETALILGSGDLGLIFEFIPPVALHLNFWLPKPEKKRPG